MAKPASPLHACDVKGVMVFFRGGPALQDHVAYDVEEGRFDADCPSSHPVKIPEIHLYFRISDYQGGEYTFSDGTSIFHAQPGLSTRVWLNPLSIRVRPRVARGETPDA